MASPNVDFYQRQKDLQDQVTASEKERMQLDKQLKLLMQSDQNSSQMKATKLHSYWKKICADEKRAQQRNNMLVREFERIDSHLTSMEARTQRLNFLKQQYADYVARTYPKWTQTVEQHMKGETRQENRQSAEVSNIRRSQDWSEAEKDNSTHHQQQQQHQQQLHHQQQHQQQNQHHHQQQQQQQRQPQQWMARLSRDESSAADDSSGTRMPMSQPIQSISVQRVASSVKGGNVGDVSSKTSSATPTAPTVRAVETAQQQQKSGPHPGAPSAELESPKSEYMNISHFSNKHTIPPHAGQGDQQGLGDESDFGSEDELPLSGGDASPVKSPVPREEGIRSRTESVHSMRSSGSLLPELTVEGLIRLLRHIEHDLQQGAEYYRSPILNPAEKIDLIQQANTGGALQGLSGVKASTLVLEQMSHVVRNLPEQCLIGEQLLSKSISNITVNTIGDSLTGETKTLWAAVFTHFERLHSAELMEAKEIAAVFVPCLVLDKSPHQDKAYTLLVNLLEGDDVTDASSIASPHQPSSPHHLINSNSLMEDGRVPPLKFGSLVDKPFSDDESSFFDQSMPKEPAVPLNETSAYKQMLSGTFSHNPQKAHVMTSDDTDDDDLENVLSPKAAQVPKPSAPVAAQPASEPESTSEGEPSPVAAAPNKTPVYVPTAVEQRSVFGSTISSQGQKRPGLKLGSDFETDSEVEPAYYGSMKKPAANADSEEKDEFDFYVS